MFTRRKFIVKDLGIDVTAAEIEQGARYLKFWRLQISRTMFEHTRFPRVRRVSKFLNFLVDRILSGKYVRRVVKIFSGTLFRK